MAAARKGHHLIRSVAVIYMLAVLKTITVYAYKACPVFCDCTPDKSVGPWALRAQCDKVDLTQVPQITPNITYIEITSSSLVFLDGLAFSEAPFLRTVTMTADRLSKVSKDAFQPMFYLSSINIASKQTVKFEPGLFRNLSNLENLLLITKLTDIPSKELCGVSKLATLRLTNNIISSVGFDPCVEMAWNRLRELDLNENPLSSIQADNFKPLTNTNITRLSINQCGLVELPSDLFRYLTHLTWLDLGGNKFSSLPPGIFDHLSYIKTLVLKGTYLTELPFSKHDSFMSILGHLNIESCVHMNLTFSQAFLNATRLKVIIVSGLRLHEIGDSLFSNLVNSPIEEVNLGSSNVNEISANAFRPLQSIQKLRLGINYMQPGSIQNVSKVVGRTQLKELWLDDTGLTTVDNHTFGGFSANNSLSFFSLRSNRMTTIGRNSFANLCKITKLDLTHNSLTLEGLNDGAFTGLDSLLELNFDHNTLADVPSRDRVGLPSSLQILNIEYNGMTSIPDKSLQEYGNLTRLSLSHNSITRITSLLFRSLTMLTYLDLGYNQISHVHELTFLTLTSLQRLVVNHNELRSLPFATSVKLSVLEELDVEGNSLFAEHAKDLATLLNGFVDLKSLSLGSCAIGTLPTNMFRKNHKLDMLQLSSNRISSWEPEFFKPAQNLTILALAHNKITNIEKSSFMYLVSLRQLDLADNAIACTCDLLWFKQWVSTADLYLVRYGIKERYMCASPPSQKGTPLVDFQLTQDDCASHFVLHLSIGLSSSVILLCGTISVTYRYWWYVRYYIFLLRSRHRQAKDAVFEDAVFKYDVFVCYHNTSLRWVINKLLPELEYKGGIKLCLHDRDWLAGPTILDNIVESIEHSRKTLLLVNNGFAQSAWCREETSLAYHRLVREQRNMLTIVLMEDIQQEKMDKTLRSIMTNRVYLRYSESKRKEPRFWKALRVALGKPEIEGNVGMRRVQPNC